MGFSRHTIAGFCNSMIKRADYQAGSDGRFVDDKSLSRYEKTILRREATKMVDSQMTEDEQKLRKDLKYYQQDMPFAWGGYGVLAGIIPAAIAGAATQEIGAGAGRAAKEYLKNKGYPGFGSTVGVTGQVAGALAKPFVSGKVLITSGRAGYALGELVAQKRIQQRHLEAERKYKELYDQYYHDPQFRDRVGRAMELLAQSKQELANMRPQQ